MIQANELRIGNWLNDGKPFQVDAADILTISRFPLLGTEETVKKQLLESLYKPIPLTPELLEKCGFVKNRADELSIELWDISTHLEMMEAADNYYTSFTQTPEGSDERTVFFSNINSLHQLQNLYFALTGTELTIKL